MAVMKLNLDHERFDDYLLVRLEGQWTRDNIQQAIADIAGLAQEQGHNRILVDARGLSEPENDLQRFEAGEHIARMWRGLKVVVIYPEKWINKFTENTAVNRGVDMMVVSDYGRAEKWLTDSSARPSITTE